MHPDSTSSPIRNLRPLSPREGGPTLYTNGFLFSFDRSNVALITKARPKWQAGKLNGIGGHTEPGELPIATQIREFGEEAGCLVVPWRPVCRMQLEGQWEVAFFAAFGDYPIRTMTDEPIDWYPVEDVVDGTLDVVPNLRWLIPMALQGDVCGYVMVDPEFTRQEG